MSEDLKILKPGHQGSGILIEQDAGYIDPSDKRNKPFVNEVKKLDAGNPIIAAPLILFVILQKWGVKK